MRELVAEADNPAERIKAYPELASEPDLEPDLAYFLDAFFLLHPRRQIHMAGEGAIPLSEIEAYCRLYNEWDPAFFAEIITFLDGVFLLHMRDKRNEKPGPKVQRQARATRRR